MIDSVGYTEDGKVWMHVLFKHDNEPVKMIITMSQQQAQEVSKSLAIAVEEASKYNEGIVGSNGDKGVAHVRNSRNIN